MGSPDLTHEQIRAQVQRMVASATFSGAQRAIRLLSYVVEETLAGRSSHIKEYTLGAEGLGRGTKFDPRTDATARVEASRLRSRIDLYYAKEGATDPVRISLPKGTYVPEFTGQVAPAPPAPARSRTRLWPIAAAAAVAVAAGIAIFIAWPSSPPLQSLAVLPFATEPETEYLADGLTEDLINQLSQLDSLRVTARSVAFGFKGKNTAPRDVGRQLDVSAVLTGRVTVRNEILTAQIDLVDTESGSQTWGKRYERSLGDLIGVQQDIARQVAERLHIPLTGAEKRGLAKRYTDSSDAYQLYLHGLYYSSKPTAQGIPKAIEHYSRALEIDPTFAPAYVKLATLYILQSAEHGSAEFMQRARAAVEKAIALDNELAEAHAEYGFIKWIYDLDREGAERELRIALTLNPNSATVHYDHARVLAENGRFDEALTAAQRAIELDPLSMQIRKRLPYALFLARRYDESIAEYQKLIELAPDFMQTQRELGLAYEQKGLYEQALQQFNKAASMPESYTRTMVTADRAHVYALMGRPSEARQILNDLTERAEREYISAYDIAVIYAALEDADQAFVWLAKALEQRPFFIGWIKVDPRLDGVRSDARFAELLARFGLDR